MAGEIIFPAIVGPTGHILFQFVTNISTQYLTRLDREIHEPIFDKIFINNDLMEFQEYFRLFDLLFKSFSTAFIGTSVRCSSRSALGGRLATMLVATTTNYSILYYILFFSSELIFWI